MPRRRDRTTSKASWTVETLECAIQNLRNGGTSVFKVAKETGIPYSTLKKRYKLAKVGNDAYNTPPKLGRYAVFNGDQEKELADHLHKMSKLYYGLTKSQFRKICYDLAVKFGVAKRFNEVNKTAGKDWLYGFLQRHPDLSIRKPEATSVNRILGFNKVEINRFFENLESVMLKYKFEAENVYNADETGVTTVQETQKIIAPKGQKRVGAVTSWERGKNVTVICAMSASGLFIPPLFIFPRQRHSPQLEKDGPPGAIYACSHNGWTNENIFVLWLKHFIKHSKPTAERPVLLIIDNHSSHCTLEAWELAKSNHTIMLTIPPHSSHRLQPLDVSFFGPLKRAYNKECDMYIKSKNMVKITPYEIAGLFNKAYSRVASLEKGISGFKATGILPMNPAVFDDEDFINTVDIEQPALANLDIIVQSTSNQTQQLAVIQQPVTVISSTIQSASNKTQQQQEDQLPITVEQYEKLQSQPGPSTDFASALSVLSPKPLPQISTRKTRQKQHSEILTSTPMKAVFEEKQKKRVDKYAKINTKEKSGKGKLNQTSSANIKGTKRKKNIAKKKKTRREVLVTKVKKSLFISDEEESSNGEVDENEICDDSSSEYSEEENLCAVCLDTGKGRELWYRCRSCGKWSHAECSGSDSPNDYICAFCLDP